MNNTPIYPALTLSLPKRAVLSLAFSPNGEMIAGGTGGEWSLFQGRENVIRIWESQTGQLLYTLTGHLSAVTAVAFSLDGSLLASGSLDGTIKLWNAKTFQERLTLNQPSSKPWKFDGKPLRISLPKIDTVAFHPNQQFFAAGTINDYVSLWDCNSGEEIVLMGGHSAFTSIAFSSDGKLLATCDDHAGYNLFDVSKGEGIYPPSAKVVVGGIQDRGLTSPTLVPRLKTVNFSPNGTVLAGGGFKGSITLWNVGTGEKLYQFRGHKDIITSLAFSPDGKLLASSSWDSKIKLWNPETAEQMYILEGHTKEIYAIAFSPDGSTLVSSSADKTIRLWRCDCLS